MYRSIVIATLVLIPALSVAQDVVTMTNGKKTSGKVTKVDSANVYLNEHGRPGVSIISRSKVTDITYGSELFKSEQTQWTEPRNSLTIGFLEGGGSLIGLDFEVLVSKRTGLQVGAGVVGFGAGLNVHFNPSIRSSYFSLQYWHQGYMDTYTQSMIGPSLVFRGRKIFTGQIGLGYLIEEGPARPESLGGVDVMLTYAVGLYFPF